MGAGTFERVTNPDNSIEYRHYLPGLDGTAGVLTRRIDTSNTPANGNAISGGDCGSGAFAGAAGAALPSSWSNPITKGIIGGISAKLAGGKFANGAFTASFNYLLNDTKHAEETGDPTADAALGERRRFGAAAKKVADGASATGDVIEEVATEVAIGKGLGAAGVVAKEAAYFHD